MHGHAYAERTTDGIKATSPEGGEGRGGSAQRGARRGPSSRESSIASEQRGVISGCVEIPEPGARVPHVARPFLFVVVVVPVPTGCLRRLGVRARRPRSVLNPSLMLC